MEKEHESHSKPIVQETEVAVSDPVGKVPLKEKKRHRDGHSSRPHHSKKLKDPVGDSGRGEVPLSAKSGVEVHAFSSLDVSTPGGAPGGLCLCRAYIGKVCRHS